MANRNIVEQVKEKLLNYSEKFKKKEDYDFWNEHIKFVFQHAHDLAIKRNADVEVCELGALFHDISMPAQIGSKAEHEKHSVEMASSILTELNYPKEKIDLVVKCVLHHRGSKNDPRDTLEEQIIADADVMAHFDNIPALFSLTYNEMKLSIPEGRESVKNKLLRDYKKLSLDSKKDLKQRFEMIMEVLFLESI